jgi:chaperone modulatory protein CbpM
MSDKDVEILGNNHRYTLVEFCERCGLGQSTVMEWVEFGVIEPHQQTDEAWQFTPTQLSRIEKARRLHQDLEINPAGLALALDLLEELECKRKEVESLRHRLGLLP